MSLAPPSSQSANERPIAFLLTDDRGEQLAEPIALSIRPESLTRQDPSRIAVQQTLGGAWADSFGAGLASITISGHTGWRRNVGSSPESGGRDGVERFLALRETVFARWHDERDQRIRSGQDPNGVQLIFSDALDRFGAVVAPQTFVLQRSRSRPLLMQYQISMTVLTDNVGFKPGAFNAADPASDILMSLGLDSLAVTVSRIEGYANQITRLIDTRIGLPAAEFMRTTAAVYRRVETAARSVDGVASSLIGVARTLSAAGMNVFRAIGVSVGLPQRAMALIGQVATAYSNAFCLLRNAVRRLPEYDDYSDLYGASNCSSVSGGRGLSVYAGSNTLAAASPAPASPAVLLTPSAESALQSMARADVVLAPPSLTTLLSSLQTVNLGTEVSA